MEPQTDGQLLHEPDVPRRFLHEIPPPHHLAHLCNELYNYIAGIVNNHDGKLLEIGGIEDHVHLLIAISPKMAVADMVRLIKANSSKWVNDERKAAKFQWQTGYAAFTVSRSLREPVREYIQGQEEHHRHVSFQEEFLAFLERHEIAYDPRYAFEDEYVG